MVPVMVPVAQNFPGDSVVVTPDQLKNIMAVAPAAVAEPVLIQEPVVVKEGPVVEVKPEAVIPKEEPAVEVLAKKTVEQNIASVNEAEAIIMAIAPSPAPSLAAIDDTFVLAAEPTPEVAVETVQEPEPTPVAVVEVVQPEQTITVEPTPSPVTEGTPIINVESTPIPATESAQTTQTALSHEQAHQEFLNTWLQLASINLNRPDLLNLIRPIVRTITLAPVTTPAPVVEPVVDVKQDLAPKVTEAVSKTLDVAPIEVTEEVSPSFMQEEVPLEPLPVEEMIDITTLAPMSEQTTLAPEEILAPVEPETLVTEATVQEVSAVTEPVVQVIRQQLRKTIKPTNDFRTNEILTNEITQPARKPFVHPFITARDGFSGFQYNFSHSPRPGTFFFNTVRV